MKKLLVCLGLVIALVPRLNAHAKHDHGKQAHAHTKSDVSNTSQKNVVDKKEQPLTFKSEEFLIDTIQAIVYGQSGAEIITMSDVERPSLTGQMRKIDDLVFERMVILDAAKHKIPMDEEAVDKYLQQIMRENGMTPEQLNQVFTAAGYTPKEGREQFSIMQTVNTMLDFKVRSGLIVPRRDIELYYEAHPETIEAQYLVQYARVPFDTTQGKDAQRKELVAYAKTGKGNGGIAWSDPFWISKDEVAQDKIFIFDLPVGTISPPQETATGFELYRVKDTKEPHLRTLDERYREISDILRQPRYQQLLTDYRTVLMTGSIIVYL
jgi:hypothetical protein